MTRPIRVLHVNPGNLYGGIEAVLVAIARERHHTPDVDHRFAVCFDGRFAQELASSGVPPVRLPSVRVRLPWTVWLARRALQRAILAERIDLVVCHGPWSHGVFAPAARRAGCGLVYWLHIATDGRHWLERWAARTPPDLVLCTSNHAAATLATIFPNAPFVVIYHAIPAPPPEAAAARNQTRTAHGISGDVPVIVQVSRFEPRKGHRTLFDALGRLPAALDWRCWIVGGAQRSEDQRYLDELTALVDRSGLSERVEFLGESRDVATLLAGADIFCHANIGAEGYPVAFVEALYAGLPVITTPVGGGAEIVDDSCGILVPPSDAAALAAALQRLVRDAGERRRMGAAAPVRARKLSDPAQQLRALAVALQGAAQRRAP